MWQRKCGTPKSSIRRTSRRKPLLIRVLLHRPFYLAIIGAILGIALCKTIFLSSPICDSPHKILAEIRLYNSTGLLKQSVPALPLKSSKPMFQTRPFHPTYFAPCQKNCHAAIRAFRAMGWTKVNTFEEGTVLYSQKALGEYVQNTKPWQRYNHIVNASTWSRKKNFRDGLRRYEARPSHRETGYFSYLERAKHSFMKLESVLRLGYTVAKQLTSEHEISRCHSLLTWSDGRPLAVRVFWLVASMDPLLVLYQDGYVRIGYDETSPRSLDSELQVSFNDFEAFLVQHVRSVDKLRDQKDPMNHVRHQFKEATSIFVDIFRDTTFKTMEWFEDGYELYAFDFVLDENLNVWLFEAYTDEDNNGMHRPFMHEDYYFLLEKNHELYYGMALTLQDIWNKQSQEEVILPLESTGAWELVYAGDAWTFEYGHYWRHREIKLCK